MSTAARSHDAFGYLGAMGPSSVVHGQITQYHLPAIIGDTITSSLPLAIPIGTP